MAGTTTPTPDHTIQVKTYYNNNLPQHYNTITISGPYLNHDVSPYPPLHDNSVQVATIPTSGPFTPTGITRAALMASIRTPTEDGATRTDTILVRPEVDGATPTVTIPQQPETEDMVDSEVSKGVVTL